MAHTAIVTPTPTATTPTFHPFNLADRRASYYEEAKVYSGLNITNGQSVEILAQAIGLSASSILFELIYEKAKTVCGNENYNLIEHSVLFVLILARLARALYHNPTFNLEKVKTIGDLILI